MRNSCFQRRRKSILLYERIFNQFPKDYIPDDLVEYFSRFALATYYTYTYNYIYIMQNDSLMKRFIHVYLSVSRQDKLKQELQYI